MDVSLIYFVRGISDFQFIINTNQGYQSQFGKFRFLAGCCVPHPTWYGVVLSQQVTPLLSIQKRENFIVISQTNKAGLIRSLRPCLDKQKKQTKKETTTTCCCSGSTDTNNNNGRNQICTHLRLSRER